MTRDSVRHAGLTWAAILLVVFGLLGAAVGARRLAMNDTMLLTLAQAPASRPVDLVAWAISLLGSLEVTGAVAVVAGLRWLRSGEARGAWLLPLAAVVGVTAMELAVKVLLHQPDPPRIFHRSVPNLGISADVGNSFPSGHAARAALTFGLLGVLLAARRRRVRWLWAALAAVWVLGYTRVYLGTHWPTDVAGGILLGGAALAGLLALLPDSVRPGDAPLRPPAAP